MDADATTTAAPAVEANEAPAGGRADAGVRKVLLWGVPAIVLLVVLYVFSRGGTLATTDNAYVKQDRIDVTALVSANVRGVRVHENARVGVGDPVLELDTDTLRAAVARASADLANARLAVESLRAAYRAKQAEVAAARDSARFANREYARQRELVTRKLVAEAALDEAHRAADAASGQVAVLGLQLAEARARLGGDPAVAVDEHPAVRAAAAELQRAQLDLDHAVLRAPRAGIVSHLPQAGDHVEQGKAAFAVVVSDGVYVEANLKETDLGWVKPGQAASIVVDLYPGFVWHGHVESVAQATGAEFALLPAQNASGNWVKVVQRIPVRIALDANPRAPALRSGASAEVEIQTDAPTRLQRWVARLHG